MTRLLPATAFLLTAASCAEPKPAPVASGPVTPGPVTPGPVASKTPKSCGFESHSGRFRSGDNFPFSFEVKAGSQWCFDGFGFSGLGTEAASVINQPRHGDIRLVHQQGNIIIGYRPTLGYSGSDHFAVGLPAQGFESRLDGTVTIDP